MELEYDIVVATGNMGKMVEIASILAAAGGKAGVLRVLTLKAAIGYMPDVDENGETLLENACIKADAARKALWAHACTMQASMMQASSTQASMMQDRSTHASSTHDCSTYACSTKASSIDSRTIVIADDSGLFVDSLGGRPGIHSARYAGPDATPATQIGMLLDELRGVAADMRAASFRCAVAINYPDGSTCSTEGICEGIIGMHPKGGNGFGYDPVFFLPEYGLTMAELSSIEKNKISHRAKAIIKAADEINAYLINHS